MTQPRDWPEPATQTDQEEPAVLSVSALTSQIKAALESNFPMVWVEGEVSNLARPQSGHIYFTLKDEAAQIRAAIWRSTANRLRFDLQDGMQIVGQGALEVYPPRGTYQLILRRVEPKGVGALEVAFRRLHAKLSAEGLFAAELKRSLPRFPRRVAFVTSPTGAAIRDFLEVVRRRWLGIEVLVVPARVQGKEASAEIVQAIRLVHRLARRPDVLVVGRGGGSLEDLWCFNDEAVVRAVRASEIPTVSAVGHEIDVTLCDLAADVRALTPSEAAEIVVPSGDEMESFLKNCGQRLNAALRSKASQMRTRLEALAERRVLRRPFEMVHDLSRRLDDLQARLTRATQTRVARTSDRLDSMSGRLDALNPLAVLSRGYSLTQRTADGQLVIDQSTLSVGDQITSILAHGKVVSCVEQLADNTTENVSIGKEENGNEKEFGL